METRPSEIARVRVLVRTGSAKECDLDQRFRWKPTKNMVCLLRTPNEINDKCRPIWPTMHKKVVIWPVAFTEHDCWPMWAMPGVLRARARDSLPRNSNLQRDRAKNEFLNIDCKGGTLAKILKTEFFFPRAVCRGLSKHFKGFPFIQHCSFIRGTGFKSCTV